MGTNESVCINQGFRFGAEPRMAAKGDPIRSIAFRGRLSRSLSWSGFVAGVHS